MSLRPFGQKQKDPSSTRAGQFDWTSWLNTGVSISGTPTITVTGPDNLLVVSAVVVSGTTKVNYQVTGGTLGGRYTVTCRIVTDEIPSQTDDRSVIVLIENQ